MGKLDDLRRLAGNNADDSMGVNRASRAAAEPVAAATPARWQGVNRSKSAAEIPVDRIRRDPAQPREHFDEDALEQLAASIRVRGVLQPIRVRWDEGQGAYIVVCGERRWRAAERAGLATISCVVMDGPIDPAELFALQMVENALREDLKPAEQAKAFRALMDRNGWSARRVAEELHYPQSSMVKVLELLDLPEPIQQAVDRGDLALTTAYELRKVDDPAEQVAIAERVAAERLTREEAGAIIRSKSGRSPAKGRAGARAKSAKITSRKFRTASGTRITFERVRGLDVEGMLADLEEISSQLRAERGSDSTPDARAPTAA